MSLTGWVHATLAIIALLTGAANLLRAKGTVTHRWTGRAFAVSMVGLNLTALMIYRLTGHFEMFHALALLSLTTLAAAVLPVLLRRPRRYWLEVHYFAIGIAYAGLIAAFGNELLVRVPFLQPIMLPAGIFNAAAVARIFQVSNVLSATVTLLTFAVLAWRFRNAMARLGRRGRSGSPVAALPSPAISAATLTGLGQVLILLGSVAFASNTIVQFWPGAIRAMVVWLNTATLAATLIIASRHRGEPADLRWVTAYFFLLLFSTVWSGMLGHFTIRDLMAFRPTVIMFGLVVLGVYMADAVAVVGLAATALIVVGYRFIGPWFPLWVAIIAGGAEAWAGWRLLTLRPHSAVQRATALTVQAAS